jgi:hypothetical protein
MKWKIISGIILAAVAAGVALNYKDIRRYVRLSTM